MQHFDERNGELYVEDVPMNTLTARQRTSELAD